MPGPRCVKFLTQKMFPGNHLIVETIMEHDARRRFKDMVPIVSAFNYVIDNELQKVLETFYDEFAKDKSFISSYGLHIPTVVDDLMDESISIAVDLYNSITTTLTKEEYIQYVFEYIASGIWSKKIAYRVVEFELTGLNLMRTHLSRIQEEMDVNYGPLL